MSAADLIAGLSAPSAERAETPARRTRLLPAWLLALWLAAPLLPVLLWSFGRGWFFPDLVPDFSLSAYAYAFSPVSGMVEAFATSLGVALAASILSLAVGIPAGRALGLHDFPGKGLVEALILAPAVVPVIAIGMGLHGIFIRLGLAGTPAGVMLVHLVPALPYSVLVIAAAFANHDTAYEDQARMLGAGRLAVLRHVTLPMLAPAIAVAGALAFLVSWSQYALTLLIGAGRVTTMPLILTQFAGAGRLDVAGVAAVFTVLPGALVLAASSRHLARVRPRPGRRRGGR